MYIVTWIYKSNHLDTWNGEPISNVSMITFDRRNDAYRFVQDLVDQNPGNIKNLQLFKKIFGAFQDMEKN